MGRRWAGPLDGPGLKQAPSLEGELGNVILASHSQEGKLRGLKQVLGEQQSTSFVIQHLYMHFFL